MRLEMQNWMVFFPATGHRLKPMKVNQHEVLEKI